VSAPPDLSLPTRAGLSADIAFLRAAYPQPTWRTHRNFGELAAFWLQVHDSLREQSDALRQAMTAFREGRHDAGADSFSRQFVSRFNHFLQHLTGHHQIEDAAYFPRFRTLDPRMVVGFELLEHDHALIHETLLGAVASARALLAALPGAVDARRRAADLHAETANRLHTLLARHLADEEDLVIPAMLEHGERSIG
jgi:hemerythrin-like domain-containing protein